MLMLILSPLDARHHFAYSKSMKNTKALVGIAALALIALVGGTFAYFRMTWEKENSFGVADYTTTISETFTSPAEWTPCTETPKIVNVVNAGNVAVAARIKIAEQRWDKLDDERENVTGTLPLTANSQDMAVLGLVNTSDWVLGSDGYYYYQSDIAAGETSSNFIESVTFNCEANTDYAAARYHLVLQVETIQANAKDNWN